MQEKFSIFIPIEIEKSGKTGEEKYSNMKFKGIASNPNHGMDKQGQWLDPAGFNLNQFLNEGTINWHHRWKDKPSAIIGQPTKASITKSNELYVEGVLYPSSPLAREVYDLAEVMEKDSPDRRMGFSIEGIPLATDPKDKNKIIKAKITNLAITPQPVCPGTRMEIIKGGLNDLEFESETDYLIDIMKDGIRYTVDKNLTIEKSNPTDSSSCHTQNAETAEQKDRVTTKESLEGAKKKKKRKEEGYLTKGELISELIFEYNLDEASCKRVYDLCLEIDKNILKKSI